MIPIRKAVLYSAIIGGLAFGGNALVQEGGLEGILGGNQPRQEQVVERPCNAEDVCQTVKIHYMKQLHNRPEFNETQRMAVGRSQHKILKELYDLDAKHIFVESLYEDFMPDDPARDSKGINMASAVNLYFPEGYQNNVTQLQLDMLCELGAAKVYAYLNKDVTLHRTLDKQESDEIDKRVNEELAIGTLDLEYIFDRREKLAVEQINSVIKEGEVNELVLIYGAAHEFRNYWDGYSNINFVEYRFSFQQ